MKEWTKPGISELNLKSTAYAPEGGTKEDGEYISVDGKFDRYTFGPSGENSGEPAPQYRD